MKESIIKQYTAAEINAMIARGEDKTDWDYIRAMPEPTAQDYDPTDPDDISPEEWAASVAKMSASRLKESLHLRVDREVVAWFKKGGRGYQTRMNAVLKAYVKAQGGGTPG
jgi:uncharacterized protein (DUF4415 family)